MIIGIFLTSQKSSEKYPKIDLPEEYSQIDSTICLKGYFDKENTLHIEFNNK
jgi:hypothetical protein